MGNSREASYRALSNTPIITGEDTELSLSLGPQHPAVHGPWGFRVKLEGETIVGAEPILGYIHRGVEKLFENRTYYQGLILAERVCFMDNVNWQLSYVQALEALAGIEALPLRADWLRAIAAELNRISSHLFYLASYGHDLGLMLAAPIGFRERDLAVNLLDKLTGHRITYNYIRPGGVARDAKPSWISEAKRTIRELRRRTERLRDLFLQSEIFSERTRGIGVITRQEALDYMLTGPVMRASGIPMDLRAGEPYLRAYEEAGVNIALGSRGDAYDRTMVRIIEIEESTRIIEELLDTIPGGPVRAREQPVLIYRKGIAQGVVEGARGWFQYLIVSSGRTDSYENIKPYRVKISSPSIQMVDFASRKIVGMPISDAIAFVNSLDLCIGETER